MRSPLAPVAALFFLVFASWSFAEDSAPKQALSVPPEKQTVPGLYVTAKEAYERWKADPEHVKILDVRTPEEYVFVGHPAMAWNVPFKFVSYEWDAAKKDVAMKPNPNFVAEAQQIVKPGDTLLVTCRSGQRSAAAVNALAEAGLANVFSITDGVEGDKVKDPESVFHGQRMKNGWKNSGLPWTCELDPKLAYLPAEK